MEHEGGSLRGEPEGWSLRVEHEGGSLRGGA